MAPTDDPGGPDAPDEHRQDGVGEPDALERLWTPHRMAYIRGENKPGDAEAGDGCPFCRIPGLPDDEGLVIHRGETAWEHYYTKDRALAPVEKPPFHAAPFLYASLGTKGGPRTNRDCQVLRPDGSVIGGLYCAGIAMASPIGTRAVGAGTTIGPCLTFGYIAGRAVIRRNA